MNKIIRKDLFTHNMVHHNPGLARYESAYNDADFLKERGYNGKTFFLDECAQYGLTWDGLKEKFGRTDIFPKGSEGRDWVLKKKEELREMYQEATDAGLQVSFMMDIIVLPTAVLEIYPEILDTNGRIDIKKSMTKLIMEEMFEEMFREFPQIHGIYTRFGETYTGSDFGLPFHKGNNPILHPEETYHLQLLDCLVEEVCKKHDRQIYYRNWCAGSFQYSKEAYLKISNQVEPHPNLYFCIKHTNGDFHRGALFNECLNCGRHRQIVEVQAAREYEGKGAYPNYIGDGVINGFEEYKWLMSGEENSNLRDIINREDSLIDGIWTWSRGGGWDGPFINGHNGRDGQVVIVDGAELWCDLNAYVISHWAKDTGKSDRYYVLEYGREVLGMDEADCETFWEICQLSARGVLLGRGCNSDKLDWDVWWMRDQNINPKRFWGNIDSAAQAGQIELLLREKRRSVEIWQEIVSLADQLTTGSMKEYIRVTCRYGYLLFAICETMYRANIFQHIYGKQEQTKEALVQYDRLWEQWTALKEENSCCPTLYAKEDVNQELIGYSGNRGFDSVMKRLEVKL